MKLLKLALAFGLVSILAGCSSSKYAYQDRETSYLKAKSIAPTKIPPGLVSNGFHSYYPVSLKYYPASIKQVSIIPPGLPGAA